MLVACSAKGKFQMWHQVSSPPPPHTVRLHRGAVIKSFKFRVRDLQYDWGCTGDLEHMTGQTSVYSSIKWVAVLAGRCLARAGKVSHSSALDHERKPFYTPTWLLKTHPRFFFNTLMALFPVFLLNFVLFPSIWLPPGWSLSDSMLSGSPGPAMSLSLTYQQKCD